MIRRKFAARFMAIERKTRTYLIIGASVYAFEIFIIFIAQQLGATPLLAVGLSFWLGLIVSFGLQKLVTFRDKRLGHRVLIPQLIAFMLLVIVNFGFTIFVTQLLSGIVSPFVSRTGALGITAIWNFYLYKTRLFKADTPTVY